MPNCSRHPIAGLACLLGLAIGCGGAGAGGADADHGDASGALGDGATSDSRASADGGHAADGGAGGLDSGGLDSGGGIDATSSGIDAGPAGIDASPDATTGILTGGPCLSGAAGATAYRIRWANGGGTAYVVYEVNGLPDHSRDHAGAYGAIGFTPSFVDPYLGEGGLLLDGSDFVDLQLTTAGVTAIASATLSIYGRSYNTTASGSFNWQSWDGYGETPTNLVSNVAPYQWYAGDMTTEISPGDDGVLIRIKAGPSSGSLVVNRIELCMLAE